MRGCRTIVVGLGAMGSATICQLARRGESVIGIDQFSPPHALGSTHGDTRITRLAIGEGEHYTPLALRSHQLWRELERDTGAELMNNCGGLVISSSARTAHTHVEHFFDNTIATARRFAIAHELLDATDIRRRFPQFKVADDERGYLERDAGFLRPEACVEAQLKVAEGRGAEIHRGERVVGFDASDHEVTLATDKDSYSAGTLVLAAGPWLPQLVDRRLAQHFAVYRQTLFWFDIAGEIAPYLPASSPVFIWELKGRQQGIYGFPAIDGPAGGIKIATERYGETTNPAAMDREVSGDEKRAMYADYVAPYVAGIGSRCVKATTCLYTVTPDFGFVVDVHPDSRRVVIVSPCSGHGFKHSPAIGEAVADLVTHGATTIDIAAFGLGRFVSARRV